MFALCLNVVALAASLFVYRPFFEENDDAFISMIAEGAYGTREPHLIYTNIILGYFYKGLYSLCPSVRWHSVLQYLFLFIGLTALTYIIQKICGGKLGRIISVIFTLTVSFEAYVSMQYSKTAAFISTIAYICLLYGFRPNQSMEIREGDPAVSGASGNADGKAREATILCVIAFILLVYGMLLRDSSFMLATLLMLPLGIFEFIVLIKRGVSKAVVRFIISFAAAACALLIFTCINKAAYNGDAAWKGFMEYNDARMQIQDFRYDLLDYNRYGSRLEEMGISENDAVLYLTWQFGDDTVLTTEAMKNVLDGAPKRQIIECLKGLAKHIYEDVLIMNPLVIGLLLIITYTFTVLKKRRSRGGLIVLAASMLLSGGILVYYEYSGRWSHRIVFAAMLVMSVSVMYLMIGSDDFGHCIETRSADETDTENGGSKGVVDNGAAACVIALLVVACFAVLLGNRFEYNDYRRNAPSYRDFLEGLSNDEDTLYIADTFTFQRAYRFDVLKPYAEGSLKNFAAVGSWFVNSPVTKRITLSFGYENPYTALAGVPDGGSEGGNVVLVDNMYTSEKLKYLNEHYGDYSFEELPGRDGFALYRVVR